MKRRGIIFARIEKSKNFKFPAFLKNILIESKKETIVDIQRFVSRRLDLLKNTEYIDKNGNLKTNSFEFLPGHEALILNLPSDIDDILREQNKAKDLPSIEVLKSSFVERINDFAQKNNLNINTDNFKITHSNKQVKSLLKCTFCDTKLSITFQSSWKISNFKKHILACVKKNPEKNAQSSAQSKEQSRNLARSLSIVRALPAVNLKNVLPVP